MLNFDYSDGFYYASLSPCERGIFTRMKNRILIFSIIICVGVLACIGFAADLWLYANKPISANAENLSVLLEPGQSFAKTVKILEEKGLIKSPFRFSLISRFKGYDKKVQAGEYLLSKSMTPLQILEKMTKGEVKLYKLTIPEGLNLYQIAELASKGGFAEKAEFIEAATDKAYTREKGIEADTFEGYLFPDTYFFPRGTSARKIIGTMVDRFRSVFTPQWSEQAKRMGFTPHQVVILASIIEKETGDPSERPVISSVFHNRLKKKMRLESDPTVIYGIKNFDGNLTRKHLTTRTPYNTYMIRGLPAGPIANPGIKSLEAALYPAQTPYIYFVSKKDRTHHFSTNLKDHNKAVRKYQLRH